MGDVTLNLRPLKRFRALLENDLHRSGFGPVRLALKRWAFFYRSFVQERYDTFSKGGGNWRALKKGTIRGRRKGSKKIKVGKDKRKVAILRDENFMFRALNPEFTSEPGSLEKDIELGVRVGYGGPQTHPKGKATIADIASFHQFGVKQNNLPARKVIVPPDAKTVNQMVRAMEIGMAEAILEST